MTLDTIRQPVPWREQLARSLRIASELPPPPVEGQLTRMVGLTLEALGCQAAVGDRCEVMATDGSCIEAEVVGFAGDRLYLMPTGDVHGVKPGARVIPRQGAGYVRVGPELLGRVIDGAGEPLDGRGPLLLDDRVRLTGTPLNPLARKPIERTLDVGVRAINSLLSVGRGQRLGLFAGSGVGKSVLLG
ncbi:MAG: flagellum-specific ATP synthase FliI, partial [Pseudomonadota bacterium]